jgi:hypothetical protein
VVREIPIAGVIAVSARQWRPGPQPSSDVVGWSTDTDAEW